MQAPFRFLHASDLHLERPAGGLPEYPDALRQTLIEAPRRAAIRVVDAAIKEAVDFVVLSGGMIDPLRAGPNAMMFWEQQMNRLAAGGITVYWAGSPSDRFAEVTDTWHLNECVIRFPHDRVIDILHQRGGQPIARVQGISLQKHTQLKSRQFATPDNSPFTITVAHAPLERDITHTAASQYWALGGRHRRRSLHLAHGLVHYPGTPQGRRFEEAGPHGCTLVEVDSRGHARSRFIATDAVRYLEETLSFEPQTTRDSVYGRLSARTRELANDPFGPDYLLRWTLRGDLALSRWLAHQGLALELAGKLRNEFAERRPAAWTVSIRGARTDLAEELYNEKTVRGEFLRTVRGLAMEGDVPLHTRSSELPSALPRRLREAALLIDSRQRMGVLAEAAQLGAALLAPLEHMHEELQS